jgi:hypothetical protein
MDATVTYQGEEINLKYRPAVITPAWSSAAAKIDAEDAEVVNVLVGQVIDLVAEWDLEDSAIEGKDKRIPLDRDHLSDTPIEILGLCIQAVMAANTATEPDQLKKGK